MTLVSVIIPAYNAVETLERALRSVMAQSHDTLEIFVVDDGSTDHTAELARDTAKGDPRVRVLSQANSGVAAARNLALRQASGSFVGWLDADDLWHRTKVEKQLETFHSAPTPPSFVYSGYRLIDRDDRVIPNFRTLADVSGNTICRQISTNFFSNVSSIFVPRELALRFGGHDARLRAWGIEGAEDLFLQLQLSTIGPAACCREALVGYRMHEKNMSRGHARAAQSNIRAIEMIAELEPELPDWVIRLGKARTVGYVLHMLREGDIPGAVHLLGQLMRGQLGYTALTLLLILDWQIRAAFGRAVTNDPEVGKQFAEADPKTAPWQGHMILLDTHRRALDTADAEWWSARRDEVGISVAG